MPARLLCITFPHSFIRVTEAAFSTWSHQDFPERDMLWTRWFFRLLPQDLGSDRAQRTSPEAAALPPSLAGDGQDSQADLQSLCPPLRPLVLPALPLLSLPYTGHSSPERLTVTGMLMCSSLTFCLLVRVSFLSSSVQRHSHGDCCRQPKPALQPQRERPGC